MAVVRKEFGKVFEYDGKIPHEESDNHIIGTAFLQHFSCTEEGCPDGIHVQDQIEINVQQN